MKKVLIAWLVARSYLAAHVADRERTPIWTFDKAFAKQTKEAKLLA